jgi:hypothetical protein
LKKIKKFRKEIENWLNIPKILKTNKIYINELKIANDKIEELETKIQFVEVNNEKLNSQVLKLKKELGK